MKLRLENIYLITGKINAVEIRLSLAIAHNTSRQSHIVRVNKLLRAIYTIFFYFISRHQQKKASQVNVHICNLQRPQATLLPSQKFFDFMSISLI